MNHEDQSPHEADNGVLYLNEDDYVMLVTPYSPEIADKIKQAGLAHDFNTRQILVEMAAADDPGWERFGNTIETIATEHQLDESISDTGHTRLVGPQDRVEAAFEDIKPHYNAKVFSALDYVAFEEQITASRQAAAHGQNGETYDASRN